MEKILYALPDLCTGCNRCVYICTAVKEGCFHPSAARVHVANFSLQGYSVPNICFQCPRPECLDTCPAQAISKDKNGVVMVDSDKCDGCGTCTDACPYGMIAMDDNNKAIKCDHCGGDPACVKECFPGALVFREADKTLRKSRALQMKQRSPSGNCEEKRNQLGMNVMSQTR